MNKSAILGASLFQEKVMPSLIDEYDKKVPHIIKYMGSKRSILEFVIKEINNVYTGGKLCDLFAGTSILAGALGRSIPIHSNDIQEYSAILAKTYLANYDSDIDPTTVLNSITSRAQEYVDFFKEKKPGLAFSYADEMSVNEFVEVENQQQQLIDLEFKGISHHLFVKYYSGTYWSYQQCLWIDALRKVADEYQNTPFYYLILSSLMYAMSYNSQSTGHYAQFRDATSLSSKTDILIYRKKEILPYFISKFTQLSSLLCKNLLVHKVTSLDYSECLDQIDENSLVYADPPYAFVHYSRFYHALETLVKYDYPKVDHKGRYRIDRHQSPFCKRTEVKNAFKVLFSKTRNKQASLILSYSNTGMIGLEEILAIASQSFGESYKITTQEVAYKHSTMGRKDDRTKDVQEYLITAKYH